MLAALLLFPGEEWFPTLLYTGLVCMVGVSLWDLFSPTNKRCEVDSCVNPQARAPMTREQGSPAGVVLGSVLTCPHCGHAKHENMLVDACQFFYECENCKTLLRPKPGDCCVFCSFDSVKCPPIQAQRQCCGDGQKAISAARASPT